jgi:hypothetical protein
MPFATPIAGMFGQQTGCPLMCTRARADDKTYLLNRRIQRIELNDIASPYRVFKPLAKLFPLPERIGYLPDVRTGAADLYSEPWTVVFEDFDRQNLYRSGHAGVAFFEAGLPEEVDWDSLTKL